MNILSDITNIENDTEVIFVHALNRSTLLFMEKAYTFWERFLLFFGYVNLLDICFHVYTYIHIKLSGKNLQTNFHYTKLKEPTINLEHK
jgi:hypothetical protein